MIDENLRRAVQVFSQTGQVSLDEISRNLRPEKLPKDSLEALAVFRFAIHRCTFDACAAAVERIEAVYRLGMLRYFYEDKISSDTKFWLSLESGQEKILRSSFYFLSQQFSTLLTYVEKGALINGVYKKYPSKYEQQVVPNLRSATMSLNNSQDEAASCAEYFTERMRLGIPPYDIDEVPEKVAHPKAAFGEILSGMALNYGDCVGVEEKAIRTAMACSHFFGKHKAMFNVAAKFGNRGTFSAAEVFQLATRQYLARADQYASAQEFLEVKALECSSQGGRKLLPV